MPAPRFLPLQKGPEAGIVGGPYRMAKLVKKDVADEAGRKEEQLDVQADGVPADEAYYQRSSYTFWWIREIFASLKAYWDIYIGHPEPILGEPEPIFP